MPKSRRVAITEPNEEDFLDAAKAVEGKVGRLLLKPGNLLCRWANTTPSNIWIETSRGTMLAHSDAGDPRCEVSLLLCRLRKFLVDVEHESGASAYQLDPAFVARVKAGKLAQKTQQVPASRPTSRRPRC